MARFEKGQKYRCTEQSCGCEIEVTKSAPESCAGNSKPRCCCGLEMELVK